MKLIAEIRKWSPFLGETNKDWTALTEQCEQYGASAFSIVTKPHWQGDVKWIEELRKVTKLPLMRRDKVVTKDELKQTKELGADWLTLNTKDFDNADQMDAFVYDVRQMGLKPVVETFFKTDVLNCEMIDVSTILVRSRHYDNGIIYSQNRIELSKMIGDQKELVGCSGINTRNQIIELMEHNYDWVLIGEAFLKSTNLKQTFQKLWMPNGEKNFK